MRINTKSAKETKDIGRILGEEIVASAIQDPIVIALEGDLGTGKTTFVKGLAQGLGIDANVVSPTFILMGTYKSNSKLKSQNSKVLHHIDPYRLDDPMDVKADLEELLKEKNAVIAIEWADKVKKILPDTAIWIKQAHKKKNERDIFIDFPL